MQALADDVIHLGLAQLREQRALANVGTGGMAVGARQTLEVPADPVLAMEQRARAGAVQDKEVRDLPRAVLAAIGPVERPERGQSPEQRGPLVGVDAAADHVGGRQST